MRHIALGLFLTAAALGVLSYWGTSTPAGRHQFDEMSGIIPFFAGIVAIVIALAGAVVSFILWKRG
jgi:hypothetical protein